jgi:tricorn protease
MTYRALFLIALIAAFATPAAAIDAPLPRHPAPSPDGSQIALSWQGDIWLVPATGGEARRLTVHPATERHPIWSKDGSMIAFASSRYGNTDVFVMPADGSEAPTRLTYASTGDIPETFTPDGTAVVFSSNRAESVRWGSQLWTVSLEGGTPVLLQDAFGTGAEFSPDGSEMVFVRGQTKWTRRGYRGPASRDLWLREADGSYTKLTDFDGTDDHPSWIADDTMVFLSSRAGRKNLFRFDLATGEATQLTSHEGSAVRFPKTSADGGFVAYEYEDGIWTVPFDGGEPSRLTVSVSRDDLKNMVVRKTARSGADEFALSPDGKLAAFIVDGDVFVTGVTSKDDQEIAKPFTARVTATTERESSLSWSPDGEHLLFSSAVSGRDNLYLAKPADPDVPWTESFEFTTTRLTDSANEDYSAAFSPDGSKIAFVRGRGHLIVIPAEGGAETVLGEFWYEPSFQWSPDGRWIAYSASDDQFNYDIWIVPAEGGEAYNVSRHPNDDLVPSWSPDGKRLVWTAKRVGGTYDVWGVWLNREDDERTPAQWLKVWNDTSEEEDADDDEGAQDDETEPDLPEVTIDFDRLWERVGRITELQGDEGRARVNADGKTIIFTAEHEGATDLYSVRWDGDDLKRLTTEAEPEQYVFDSEGTTVFYLDDSGLIKRVSLDGTAGDPVPFAARYEIDRRARREAVFDEAWRALDVNFYDADFHGVDWPAQREKYRPWAIEASTDADFADVVNLMLGELNASHMGYYPPGTRGRATASGDATGWIGVTFNPTAGGPGLEIAEVLPDSPAWRTDVAIEAGERLLAVNGEPIGANTNVFSLFADTVGERTRLQVVDADGDRRTVVVEPISYRAHRQLRYKEWVRERRRLVDEWSGGRLGYIHIQGMSIPSFEEFERGLHAAADGKEALLIDVRSNGGGWTTDYLMAVLMVQRHAYTIPRGAPADLRAYPTAERLPLTAWTKPAAALCNVDSYSNAEIFSHAFKSLGRGPLIGSPTFGAVISTGGMRTLDGALVRLPMRGWYVAADGVNMEKQGAQPDVLVWQPPAQDRSKTEDSQLARAVEVLLEGLATDPRTGTW